MIAFVCVLTCVQESQFTFEGSISILERVGGMSHMRHRLIERI